VLRFLGYATRASGKITYTIPVAHNYYLTNVSRPRLAAEIRHRARRDGIRSRGYQPLCLERFCKKWADWRLLIEFRFVVIITFQFFNSGMDTKIVCDFSLFLLILLSIIFNYTCTLHSEFFILHYIRYSVMSCFTQKKLEKLHFIYKI